MKSVFVVEVAHDRKIPNLKVRVRSVVQQLGIVDGVSSVTLTSADALPVRDMPPFITVRGEAVEVAEFVRKQA